MRNTLGPLGLPFKRKLLCTLSRMPTTNYVITRSLTAIHHSFTNMLSMHLQHRRQMKMSNRSS